MKVSSEKVVAMDMALSQGKGKPAIFAGIAPLDQSGTAADIPPAAADAAAAVQRRHARMGIALLLLFPDCP
ncbi:hypothetical protein ACFPPA_16985 [Rhodanobacter ginsengisoli]|uniref:Uncharacterized protein n=1 Tax=Rhodanobacter ginsengisoli TaxID=418646 RepID=A0ABW0QTI1_9GAMM